MTIKTPSFIPFLTIIFLNAFVDLGHKIIIQNSVFKVYDGTTQIVLITLVNGLILLPFVLLFTPAGFLSDKYAKPKVMRYSAGAAIGLTLLITLSYYQGWFYLAFGMTFLLAVQSAFYSPAKYGYIKELLGTEKLSSGNGFAQATTIVAILAGVFVFSALFEYLLQGINYQNEQDIMQQIAPIGWLLVALSCWEYFLTKKLPDPQTANPALMLDRSRYLRGHYLKQNVHKVWSNRTIWLAIIGLSVFWGIAQVVLAAFPAYAKATLDMTNTVAIQGILASSGIGIILGSLLAGRAGRHHIETGLIPLGAIGVVVSLLLLPQLTSPSLLVLDFVFLGLCGGIFIVPLNALIQYQANSQELGTILAGNNWVQNVVMLSFLGLTALFALAGYRSEELFLLLTVAALVGTIYTLGRLPQSLVRYLLGRLISSFYRIRVQGFANIPSEGAVLMLGNHISWLDWAIVQIACPRPIRFVMHRSIYQKWYLNRFFKLFGVVPIAGGASKKSIGQINQLLKNGEVVCLFPEGAISSNGQLGEFKHGYEKTVAGVDGIILPFYLRGLWGTHFSKAHNKSQNNGDVIVAFGKPLPMDTQAPELKQQVFNLSIETWQSYAQTLEPIPLAWLRTAKQGGSATSLIDIMGDNQLSHYKTITGTLIISRLIKQHSTEQNVGLLLPTSSAGIMGNLAVLLLGKTVVNLNYTANESSLLSAVEQAGIQNIYTSRRFVDRLGQRSIQLKDLFSQVRVHYLEDLKDIIHPAYKLGLLAASILLPATWLYALFGQRVDTQQAAAILFSSGSEGAPKGVMLSHQNLMANIQQTGDVLDTREGDVMLNCLPIFHAFGLTVTSLMPMVKGMPTVCHPDPTDTLTIAQGIAKYKASMFFSTATFLRMYSMNKKIHPLMLDSLRLIIAGAEKLSPEVKNNFTLKFRKEIYEGYGTTETSPVASSNVPDSLNFADWSVQKSNKIGTVGLPAPGTSFRIVDPDSMQTLPIGEDGLILISGVQVMLGYLNAPEKTAQAIVELDGQRWYKTGDKGHLDKDGYLTIIDRYSRFAKIGGEMVSLGAIEKAIREQLDEETDVFATAIPDGKKGEKIVLLYAGGASADGLKEKIDQSSLNPLMKPSQLLAVEAIPKLGSGKTDLSRAKQLVIETMPLA